MKSAWKTRLNYQGKKNDKYDKHARQANFKVTFDDSDLFENHLLRESINSKNKY
jgi:hypothetical protein